MADWQQSMVLSQAQGNLYLFLTIHLWSLLTDITET